MCIDTASCWEALTQAWVWAGAAAWVLWSRSVAAPVVILGGRDWLLLRARWWGVEWDWERGAKSRRWHRSGTRSKTSCWGQGRHAQSRVRFERSLFGCEGAELRRGKTKNAATEWIIPNYQNGSCTCKLGLPPELPRRFGDTGKHVVHFSDRTSECVCPVALQVFSPVILWAHCWMMSWARHQYLGLFISDDCLWSKVGELTVWKIFEPE